MKNKEQANELVPSMLLMVALWPIGKLVTAAAESLFVRRNGDGRWGSEVKSSRNLTLSVCPESAAVEVGLSLIIIYLTLFIHCRTANV